MKILAIRGRNLASLEGDFVIDFMVEPLRSAGIFTITGSTGSGKSTLLDTLCLALFDTTPRLAGVSSNSSIQDNKNDFITLKDSRNILRRGSSEGMAEVDFIALNGEHYRSTWSVGRAGGKANGRLKNVSMILLNLTTQIQEQGTKTDLLKQIVGLIGLTFDQFTRAVLLAQGDFATFLKAKPNEKAELLEKLTGTDIYSRISRLIYERSQQADAELALLNERIKGIELLSDEQLEALELERKQIANRLVEVKRRSQVLALKMDWIKQEEELKRETAAAVTELAEAQAAIEGAKSRYDYVARIEEVQEIRDVYNEQQTTIKQWKENRNSLQIKQLEKQKNATLLSAAVEALNVCETNRQKVNLAFEAAEPEIIKARALDVKMEVVKRNGVQAKKEFDAAKASKERTERTITNIQQQLSKEQLRQKELNTWFEAQSVYRELVPRAELVVSLLNNAETAIKQRSNSEKTLKIRKEVLEADRLKLDKLKKEAERLDHLLPAEILSLRVKLSEGVPCPVCGSLHHPLQAVGINGEMNLEEEELNRTKETVKKQLDELGTSMEESNKEITRLITLAESYKCQWMDAIAAAEGYLVTLPTWKVEFDKGGLQLSIQKVATEWNSNQIALTQANEKVANLLTTLSSEQKNLEETTQALVEKETKLTDYRMEYESLFNERAKLLRGKSADEVADFFQKEKKNIEEELRKLNDEKNKLTAHEESLKGEIKAAIANISNLEKRKGELQTSVEGWLVRKQGLFSLELLGELLQKDRNWIATEKSALEVLRRKEITGKATLEERRKKLEQHHLVDTRPQEEGETMEILQSHLKESTDQQDLMMKRNVEIDTTFTIHKQGKEKVKKIEKELPVKEQLSENWKKLNKLFGSATGSKFKEIAQGYTLEVLLTYANRHLQELSKRYELKRIPDTLGLQVVDLDMLGEKRSVHTLSGGESFLVSLALALGLSSLSSNRMKVESLFIDEGFGSLDADTLRIAMDALEGLQTQGRKIGVISHVTEMNEHIATQIRVEKSVSGKSKIEIVA